jgi:GNAT superfamily N-acetyltransferase
LVVVRVAGADDVGALAALRALWTGSAAGEPMFEQRLGAWLAAEGSRRTMWPALLGDEPIGMTSLLEYRRMPRPGQPDSRWGYLSNMFVREEWRDRGVGSLLLAAVIAVADERRYARIVLSPTLRSVPFYERAGFVVADGDAGSELLLVRSAPPD